MNEESYYQSEAARAAIMANYEEILARWPLALERMEIETSIGPSFVLAFGGGGEQPQAPLLILHGSQSNSSMWIGEARALGEGRRVYAIDIPGELGYSVEKRLPFGDDSYARWLGEVLDGLSRREAWRIKDGRGRPCLCGLSLGGWIALAYTIGRPESLGALALLCPSGLAKPRRAFLLKAILASIGGPKTMERLAASLYGDREIAPEALRLGALFASSVRPRLEEPRIFTEAELSRLRLPLYLAYGEKDVMLRGRASVRRISRLLPQARTRIVAGGGHALIGMGEEVADFLALSPGLSLRS